MIITEENIDIYRTKDNLSIKEFSTVEDETPHVIVNEVNYLEIHDDKTQQ